MHSISHYRIEREIGRGGMGVVYRAVDTRLGRAVAIKVLPADAATDDAPAGSASRHRRFVQEARAASALNHPHIVTIYEIDEHEGTTFIAMELVDGTPLDTLLAEGPLTIDDAMEYATQIASGLAAAHAAGLVHRDIKPANLIITRDGRAKILDFGLAKLAERPHDAETMTSMGTRAGLILGTAAYMSPEQAQGRDATSRSDIFSFGAVLYEMLTGTRAFRGDSDIALLTAILRDEPPPVQTLRPDAPAALQEIVSRALAKDPAARYAGGAEAHAALAAIRGASSRGADDRPWWRRPAMIVPAALALIAIAGFAGWRAFDARRAAEARALIPEIQRLLDEGDRSLHARRLARDVERYAPDVIARMRQNWFPFSFTSEPSGAEVQIRNYLDADGPWESLGATPLQNVVMPAGYYRVRITKDGYLPVETTASPFGGRVRMAPAADAPAGMVFVPGGPYTSPTGVDVSLPDFWMDTFEVTNRDYKRFVDAGGYRDARYWKEPFIDGARTLTHAEAMTRFIDSTGRPGPASWEIGSPPSGQEDFPVSGISWFEAAAYAAFAGKSLPTVHHWLHVANTHDELFADIVRVSNFDQSGPSKAGARQGLAPFGTYDMAGNAKEWTWNDHRGGAGRYILGGGWNEPPYRFAESDAQNPWLRGATFGMRLVRNNGPVGANALAPLTDLAVDPSTVVPVSAGELEYFKRFYQYDRTPLNAKVESVDTTPEWRVEKVSFDAAYGGQRVPAYLFLPVNAKPPYQTVVIFPSSYATRVASSTQLDLLLFDFIMRSGRAAIYPVYQGTFERRIAARGPAERRDLTVQQIKDLFRSVDYLMTRDDVDAERLGYFSVSMGAFLAPVPLALEPRIKAAVLVSGGLSSRATPETSPTNFAPAVKIPVLLVNGRQDFRAPAAARERFIALLGTPAAHKKELALEGGHFPQDIRGIVRHTLDWFDKYLGPVK